MVGDFTKEQLDKAPRRFRRGGEYGHDPVRLFRYTANVVYVDEMNAKIKGIKNFCKIQGIPCSIKDIKVPKN